MKAAVIANPVAGRRQQQRLQHCLDLLAQQGVSVTVLHTQAPGHAGDLTRQAVADGAEVVAVSGGDGTINEVANVLVGGSVPLAVIPVGTANVFAREIGIGTSLRRAAAAIVAGEPRPVYLGVAGDRCFVLMIGIGFDAAVVHAVSRGLKRRWGKFAYVIAGFRLLRQQAPDRLVVEVGGERIPGCHAIIGNAHFYGGSFQVTPAARLDEPTLQVCVFTGNRGPDLIRYAWGILRRRHMMYPDVVMRTGTEIHVASAGAAVPIQMDGDPFGSTPVSCRVEAKVLTVMMPRLTANKEESR
jgi:diacylglycerol kinase (ATP)